MQRANDGGVRKRGKGAIKKSTAGKIVWVDVVVEMMEKPKTHIQDTKNVLFQTLFIFPENI